jgi:RNA polymerase sigma factor for flagellar operon FliA
VKSGTKKSAKSPGRSTKKTTPSKTGTSRKTVKSAAKGGTAQAGRKTPAAGAKAGAARTTRKPPTTKAAAAAATKTSARSSNGETRSASALGAVARAAARAAASEHAAGAKPAKGAKTTKLAYWEVPVMEVWEEFKRNGADELRNYLIEYYLDIVKYTAERMHMRLPGEVDVEDLMSAGLFGLMDAIDAFDLDRGVKFETYCAQRIRGAIFDELRAMDWVPRLVRSRTAKVERARKALEMKLGRRPTDHEICHQLQVDGSEFQKLSKDSKPVGVVSLNRKWFETDSSKDVREIDVIRDTRQENPLTEIQRKDLKLLITKGLSRAERLIVILYYYEEMTMKEIGMTLDLSESRVSQMHSSILARLKAQMQHRAKEF